jgi:hypothetical protein
MISPGTDTDVNVEAVEDLGIREADGAEELRLRYFEKAQKLPVIHHPWAVCVRPTDMLFDGQFFVHQPSLPSWPT